MLTSLDALVIVFMVLAALVLLSLVLMFLLKNKTARRICLYFASALGIYLGYVGFRIGFGGLFDGQMVVGVLAALMSVGAIVLERISHGEGKRFLTARLLSAASLIVGFLNAIL